MPENGVVPPKVVYAPDLENMGKSCYTGLSATCVLSVLVDEQGKPHEIGMVKSFADGLPRKSRSAALTMDKCAMKALYQYRFEPAMQKGTPVPYREKIEIAQRIY